MKLTTLTAVTFALLLCNFAKANGNEWFGNRSNRDALSIAHEAFLAGNYKKMMLRIREVLADPTSRQYEKDNVLALLEKANEATRGELPVDWKLPFEVPKMKIDVKTNQRPKERFYGIKVSGWYPTKGTIKQMQVVRYPDQVVMDKEAGEGEWEEGAEEGGFYYELDAKRMDTPPSEGLYLLNLTLANGKKTQGWFILQDMLSSATPVIRTPNPGQVFHTGNPVMHFDNFVSPEYKGHEFRSLYTTVAQLKAPEYAWKEMYSLYEASPTRTELRVGKEDDGVGVKTLENGTYVFLVSYKERRKFGDVQIGRNANTLYQFEVSK